MKRNEFLKKIGALAGLALVAPKVLAENKEEVTGEIKKLYYSHRKDVMVFIDKGQENPEWLDLFVTNGRETEAEFTQRVKIAKDWTMKIMNDDRICS